VEMYRKTTGSSNFLGQPWRQKYISICDTTVSDGGWLSAGLMDT